MPEHKDDLSDLIERRERHLSLWRRLLFIGLGGLFIVLGIIGSLLPVMPGFPFYIAAAVCLAVLSERFRKWINGMERKLSLKWRMRLRHGIQKVPIKAVRNIARPVEPSSCSDPNQASRKADVKETPC